MSELENEFPGKVKGVNVDATTEESKRIVSDLGFKNHGIVVRDPSGSVLFKQPDHSVVMDDVRELLLRYVKN